MNFSILLDVFKKPINIILVILNIINLIINFTTGQFTWLTWILLALTILDFGLDYHNMKTRYDRRMAKLARQQKRQEARETKPNLGATANNQPKRVTPKEARKAKPQKRH